MTFSKFARRSLLLFLFSVLVGHNSHAQISKSVGLLKADVTLSDGTPVPNVPVSIFKGVDKLSTTKTSPDGKITTILQPNAMYRLVVSSSGYLYHEDTLRIGALTSYQEFPVHIVISPLKEGQVFELPQPIFAPKSQTVLSCGVPALDRIVEQLKHNPKLAVTITVYPDALAKNKKDTAPKTIAAGREMSMRSYLLGKGVAESRFSVQSELTSIPPGRFSPSDPSFPATQADPVATKSKKKKKSPAAPAQPGMVPQFVEIVAHLAQ